MHAITSSKSMVNVNFITSIQILLYIALLDRIIQCFHNLNNESTAFEETELENEVTMPSFTLCQFPRGAPPLIESFEDATKEIRESKSQYESNIEIIKSFEET